MTATSTESSYWEGKGKYQKEVERLRALIPSLGKCNNPSLEALRVVQNAYYDAYNNGACNPSRWECLKQFVPDLLDRCNIDRNQSQQFLSWLELAAKDEDDRPFYMLEYPHKEETLLVLDVLEQISDAAIEQAVQDPQIIQLLNERDL